MSEEIARLQRRVELLTDACELVLLMAPHEALCPMADHTTAADRARCDCYLVAVREKLAKAKGGVSC